MTIFELGALGEFLGSIAVVFTLIYLAIQIRQNTRSGRAQSRQTLITQWSSTNWELSRDPELLRIYAEALTNWPDLPNDKKTMFDIGMGHYLANIQNGLLLRDSGMLDDGTLDQVAGFMLICIRSSGGSKWWRTTANAFPETRKYLNEILAHDKDPTATAENLVPHWMAMPGDVSGKSNSNDL